ncbi:hypothetical protein CHUAL_004915 [Chamberlinius hualienensis]
MNVPLFSLLLLMISVANSKPAEETISSSGQVADGGCTVTCIDGRCNTECGRNHNCIICINNNCTENCELARQISRDALRLTQENIEHTMNAVHNQLQNMFGGIFA